MVVRLLLFYLLLLILQGALTVLLAPWPTPDLFLLAMLTTLWRLPAWQLVVLGYGVGLLQDVMGHGALGFHALGLAGAALVASLARSLISHGGLLERLLIVGFAQIAKWLVFLILLWWLHEPGDVVGILTRIALPETVLTLLAAVWLLPWGEALVAKSSLFRKELL